ncbi:hypothetical protein BH09MYX1_BH09MYX1_37340 [soil metagenome]
MKLFTRLRNALRDRLTPRWELEARAPDRPPPPPTASSAEKSEFLRSDMTRCVRCRGTLQKTTHGRNARADGDAYGADRFACATCDFTVDALWDEAADRHYFERA